MADKRITELAPLSAAELEVNVDVFAVADVSAAETKKITAADLITTGVGQLPDGSVDGSVIIDNSISGSKLEENSVTDRELAPDSVGTIHLQDGACTSDKILDGTIQGIDIADNSIDSNHYVQNSVDGEALGLGVITDEHVQPDGLTSQSLAPDSVGQSELADNSVDTAAIIDDSISTPKYQNASVTNEKLADGIDGAKLLDGSVTANKLAGSIDDSQLGEIGLDKLPDAPANTVLAGPESGAAAGPTYRKLVSDDLPVGNSVSKGAVSVPTTGGLIVDATGAVSIGNNVVPNTHAVVQYDQHGLITSGRDLLPSDLPAPANGELGAVKAGDGISISADGTISQSLTGVTAGTYTKVTTDERGNITDGDSLVVEDIPQLTFDKIDGQISGGRITDNSITSAKLSDYSTCLMQEDYPSGGDYFLGMFWYQPSTAQLRVYSRGSGPENIWLNVGFGQLQAQNLRFAFTFDATTGLITSITQYGAPLDLKVGDPIPAATDNLSGAYGVCVVEGAGITLHDVNGTNFTVGDWILCAGEVTGWVHIDIADGAGGGGGGGAQVLNDLLDVTIGGAGGFGIEGEVSPAGVLTDGQFLRYNGAIGQWVNVDAAIGAHTGENPPANAIDGSFWWNSADAAGGGRLYIAYTDDGAAGNGASTQWVPATPDAYATGSGGGGGGGAQQLNDLVDVNATPTANSDFLVWSTTANRWVATSTIDGGTF